MIGKSAILHLWDLSSPQRLDLAAEQLESGMGFTYRARWFLHESAELWCNTIYSHPPPDDAIEADARAEIDRSRRFLEEVCAAHPAIRRLAESAQLRFAGVDDYGQGVTPLWCLVEDRIAVGSEAWSAWLT